MIALVSKIRSVRLFVRALSLLWKSESGLFNSCFINKVLSAMIPFIYIYISSLIIEELAGNRSEARLVYLVIIMLAASFIFEIISSLVKRWANICADRFNMNKDNLFSKKLFSMRFEVNGR